MISLVTSQQNVMYLSGFSGSVAVLIQNGKRSVLVVDGRYTDQANAEVKRGIRVVTAPLNKGLLDVAAEILKKEKTKRIGYEADKTSVSDHMKFLKATGIKDFIDISCDLRDKRCVKTASELDLIRKAALIADLIYDCVIRIIKPDQTEREISAHIDYLMKIFKGDNPAFETLVSSGPLSAIVHGKPTDRIVKIGDLILMDFGVRYKGYHSDMTRMVSLGVPSARQSKMYSALLKAQEAAIEKIRPGVPGSAIDKAARDVLKKEKLDKYFTHSTGHGVGLAVHEGPRLSPTSRDVLKPGMIVTVEPGIYIKGFGGFRVEDMVLVTRNGHEVITRSPKRLEAIG